MVSKQLPSRLAKEPLLDAVFELRLSSSLPLANILPGIIFSKLSSNSKLEKLPHSQLPEAIRNNDPNLQYVPLVSVKMESYSILVGDRTVAIACHTPYKGWGNFKEVIIEIVKLLCETGFVDSVTRYSLKYVDLIESSDLSEQAKLANVDLRIGKHSLSNEQFQVRMDVKKDGFINVIQLFSGATVNMKGQPEKNGLVIDIDTIKVTGDVKLQKLDSSLDDLLEHIHTISKRTFFDCLNDEALLRLEPIYD